MHPSKFSHEEKPDPPHHASMPPCHNQPSPALCPAASCCSCAHKSLPLNDWVAHCQAPKDRSHTKKLLWWAQPWHGERQGASKKSSCPETVLSPTVALGELSGTTSNWPAAANGLPVSCLLPNQEQAKCQMHTNCILFLCTVKTFPSCVSHVYKCHMYMFMALGPLASIFHSFGTVLWFISMAYYCFMVFPRPPVYNEVLRDCLMG